MEDKLCAVVCIIVAMILFIAGHVIIPSLLCGMVVAYSLIKIDIIKRRGA